jgi:hypothetical protein
MGITQIVILLVYLTKVTTDFTKSYEHDEYVIFRDIMVMLLLGFGYLMTFLKKCGLGAVGFTMMLTVLSIQLNLIVEPIISSIYQGKSIFYDEYSDSNQKAMISIDVVSLIDGEFAAATLLISYGAIIGRAAPIQLLIMAVFQSIFYAINKVVFIFGILGAEDVGGVYDVIVVDWLRHLLNGNYVFVAFVALNILVSVIYLCNIRYFNNSYVWCIFWLGGIKSVL